MALTPNTWGPAVAQALYAWAQGNLPQNDFVSVSQLEEAWKIITTEHKEHVNNFADIDLIVNDIPVLPGTFIDSLTGPVTGLGQNQAVLLAQKIK